MWHNLSAMGGVTACIIGCAAGYMRVSTLSILVKLVDRSVVFGHVVQIELEAQCARNEVTNFGMLQGL